MTMKTTVGSKLDSARGDHTGEPKRLCEPIGTVTPASTVPANSNGNSQAILLSDEPVIECAIALIQGKWKIPILR